MFGYIRSDLLFIPLLMESSVRNFLNVRLGQGIKSLSKIIKFQGQKLKSSWFLLLVMLSAVQVLED